MIFCKRYIYVHSTFITLNVICSENSTLYNGQSKITDHFFFLMNMLNCL